MALSGAPRMDDVRGRSGRLVARLAGLEPTASSSAGMRSIHLSYKRVSRKPPSLSCAPSGAITKVISWCRRRDSNPHALFGHYILNVARLPIPPLRPVLPCSPDSSDSCSPEWWAVEGSNLGPLACEASALTTELTARLPALRRVRPFSTFATAPHEPLGRSGGGNDWTRTSDLALMKRPL